jgi:hypothetical protein
MQTVQVDVVWNGKNTPSHWQAGSSKNILKKKNVLDWVK